VNIKMPLFSQSLKKEVDWGDRSSAGDDKSITGEGSSEYRSPIDPVSFSDNFHTWLLFKISYYFNDDSLLVY
jgi:hypothetical protein